MSKEHFHDLFIPPITIPFPLAGGGSERGPSRFGLQQDWAVGHRTGTVTLEGKPVEGATVLFSRGAGKIGAGELALGKTDAQGRYELTTKVGGETEVKGALPGEYKVAVSKRVPPKGMSESEYRAKVEAANKASEAGPAAPGAPQVPESVELFPSRYSVLTRSELKATVKPGSNDIPFDLK